MAGIWGDWKASDKLPLDDLVRLVGEEVVSGAEAFGAKHPKWSLGDTTVTLRGVLKPMTNQKTGETRIFYDNDEPHGEDRSDIPVPIIRKPGD